MVEESREALLERAVTWAADDPDQETRGELEALLAAARADPTGAEAADLEERFSGTLQFGTAGLRGRLGAGPMRMNRVVVIRAAAGLAAYLLSTGSTTESRGGTGAGGSVVVGYDARRNSRVFAEDTAAVLAGVGLHPLLLPRQLPTPVLAYAIRQLGCLAGVMVTASHNPPQDNGYKVYLSDGSQIVPPADAEIARQIAAVGPVPEVPRGGAPAEVLDEDVVDSYVAAVAGLAEPGPRRLDVVYTPLHGVGAATAAAVLRRAGFQPATVVPAQAEPDPDFPTVAFPNPEEPGALDLALELAVRRSADLVVANDPDADRCAVAVPAPGGWRTLTGDELGVLLGDVLLRRGVRGVYAASIVSSSLLGKLASSHGQPYVETLTGFKWISRVPGLVYGYEEALGYCVAPHLVRDKDGLSAMLLALELAAEHRAAHRTLLDRMGEIAVAHGVHATDQLSIRVADLSRIAAMMQRLRDDPPGVCGGLAVRQVDDLSKGSDSLPPTEGLRFSLDQDARILVRPSGTEPKLKCYLEAVVPAADTAALGPARDQATARLAAIRQELADRLGQT